MTILEVHNLKKVYTTRFGGNQVQALRNIQFSVEEGEYVAIMGETVPISRSTRARRSAWWASPDRARQHF